ncbi:MAG TPA: hypothetical protein VGM83_18945 [Devosiaceae bacterium]
MAISLVIVIRSRHSWWVDWEGRPYGPMQTVEEAIASARRLISLYGEESRRYEIYAPDEHGKMLPVATAVEGGEGL